MSVSLGITRREGESWLDCALRYAGPFGLENEVREDYEANIAAGESEEQAAFCAVYNWDICDLKESHAQD